MGVLYNSHSCHKRKSLTVHGHLVDLCGVELFNVSQDSDVVVLNEVDGHTFAAESTRPTNSTNTQSNAVLYEITPPLARRVTAWHKCHVIDLKNCSVSSITKPD